jgi:hypothetical protein
MFSKNGSTQNLHRVFLHYVTWDVKYQMTEGKKNATTDQVVDGGFSDRREQELKTQ